MTHNTVFYGKSIQYANRYANRSENATPYEFYDRMEMWQMKVIRYFILKISGITFLNQPLEVQSPQAYVRVSFT